MIFLDIDVIKQHKGDYKNRTNRIDFTKYEIYTFLHLNGTITLKFNILFPSFG